MIIAQILMWALIALPFIGYAALIISYLVDDE